MITPTAEPMICEIVLQGHRPSFGTVGTLLTDMFCAGSFIFLLWQNKGLDSGFHGVSSTD